MDRNVKTDIKERFLRYAALPTNSDENSNETPSTKKQLALSEMLYGELKKEGFSDVFTQNGYVYARLPAAKDGESLPKIGFIAHIDTSPDMSDENISPRCFVYGGGDIVLSREKGIVTRADDYPSLAGQVGKELIITDGATLLGADDKAGVAEIMDMAIRLKGSGVRHGEVYIAFTPDEEIGRGADFFDLSRFAADFAYTVDGGGLGSIEYENFNAASCLAEFSGNATHPGSAKGKMINAASAACELALLLPAGERPELTEGYEGFYHLTGISGGTEKAEARFIIRDHDKTEFEKKKEFFAQSCNFLNKKYKREVVTFEIKDSYYNMKSLVEPVYHIIERAEKAMKKAGVTPKITPIRGGTDGARLTYMGLVTPNLCTGGENFHSKHEYVAVEDLKKVSEILFNICTADE